MASARLMLMAIPPPGRDEIVVERNTEFLSDHRSGELQLLGHFQVPLSLDVVIERNDASVPTDRHIVRHEFVMVVRLPYVINP